MKPFWIVVACGAAVLGSTPVAVQAQTPAVKSPAVSQKTLDAALADLKNADSIAAYARVYLELSKVLALDAKSRAALAARGEVVRRALRLQTSPLAGDEPSLLSGINADGALRDFEQTKALGGGDALALVSAYGRGRLLLDHKNDAPGALAEFNNALKLNPQFGPAYLGRAIAAGRSPKPDHKAIFADYDKAIELGFEVPDLAIAEDITYADYFSTASLSTAYHGRGLLHALQNENAKALADLNSAIAANLLNADAIFARGRLHAEMNEPQKAITDFSAVLLWRANDAEIYRLRAAQYEKLGDKKNADADRERAVRVASGQPSTPVVQTPERTPAVATPPKSTPAEETSLAAQARGDVAVAQGKIEDALREYSHAIELDPKNVAAFSARGWALARTREYSLAVADFDAALKLQPDDVTLLIARGQMNGRAGQTENAIADLRRATEIAPANITAWEQLGVVYQANGKYAEAEMQFQKATEVLVQNANAVGQETTLAALRLAIVRAVQDKTEGFDAALAGASTPQLRGALGILEFELKKHPESAALMSLRETMLAELQKLQ